MRKLVVRLKAIGDWLKQEWSRTPFVGVLTFVVAIAAATFGYLNYHLQIGRPELEPAFGKLIFGLPAPPQWSVTINWQPVGKKLARCGFATVYAADENGTRQNRLGAQLISFWDRCETVNPLSIATIPLEVSDPPAHLLICASYLDESRKKYRQAFRYLALSPERLAASPLPSGVPLEEELPRPSEEASKKLCR